MAEVTIGSETGGTVSEVLVGPGSSVAEGDELLIVEAMKMFLPLVVEQGGVVRELLVAEGDVIEEGQPVMVLETRG